MIRIQDSAISDYEFHDRDMLSQIRLSQSYDAMFQEVEDVYLMPPRHGSEAALHSPLQMFNDYILDITTAVAELRTPPEGRKVKLFN
jgi:hypothetical protein